MSGRHARSFRARDVLLPLAAAAALLCAGPALGQEEPALDVPEVAEAPRSFRIGVAGSAMLWEEAEARAPEDGALWGVDVERILFRYASVRLDLAYGAGTVRDSGSAIDVTTWLAELLLTARVAPQVLERAGVIPFLAGGVGTLVHDPEVEGLPTASQNALSWGLGVQVEPFERLGVRAEWRRYDVDLEDLSEAIDRSGLSRSASRLQATVFWIF